MRIKTVRDEDENEIKENLKRIKGGVHIAVLGFEVDRIIKVPIMGRAEKVYTITREKDTKVARKFLEIVKNELEKHNIDVKIKRSEPLTLENIIKVIKEIIKEEKEEYTEKIYINISSGSTLGAIAGTIFSMIVDDVKIIPYYVIPESYFETLNEEEKEKLKKEYKEKYNYEGPMPRTFGVLGVEFIYPFDIKLPREELIIFLKYIKRAEDKGLSIEDLIQLTTEEGLQKRIKELEEKMKKDMEKGRDKEKKKEIEEIYKKEIEKEEDELRKLINWRQGGKIKKKTTKQSDFVWINQNVVKKLLEWGLISEPIKRGRYRYITISEKGKKLLMYLE